MGDRGNIIVRQTATAEPLYLYSHWGGTELPALLQAGLKAGHGRWNDSSYLTRIIVREMGMGRDGETGFGISVIGPPDSEHPYLVVDCEGQRVTIQHEGSRISERTKPGRALPHAWTFAEYVEIDSPTWEVLLPQAAKGSPST